MLFAWPSNVFMQTPFSKSQILIFSFVVLIKFPFFITFNILAYPLNVLMQICFDKHHTLIVLSLEQLISLSWFGITSILITQDWCPTKVFINSPFIVFQILIVLSSEQLTKFRFFKSFKDRSIKQDSIHLQRWKTEK